MFVFGSWGRGMAALLDIPSSICSPSVMQLYMLPYPCVTSLTSLLIVWYQCSWYMQSWNAIRDAKYEVTRGIPVCIFGHSPHQPIVPFTCYSTMIYYEPFPPTGLSVVVLDECQTILGTIDQRHIQYGAQRGWAHWTMEYDKVGSQDVGRKGKVKEWSIGWYRGGRETYSSAGLTLIAISTNWPFSLSNMKCDRHELEN